MATTTTATIDDKVWPYIVGGLIISFAIWFHLWVNKGFISLSSNLHAILKSNASEVSSKAAIIAGLVFVSTLVWNFVGYGNIKDTNIVPFEGPSTFLSGPGIYGFMFSGFLVGLGTKLAGGGLSGHLFTGVPKFALKSIFAVLTFFGVGFLVATAKKSFKFLTSNSLQAVDIEVDPRITANVFLIVAVVVLVLCLIYTGRGIKNILASFISGGILAFGLMLSGLAQRNRVLAFLNFPESWGSHLPIAIGVAVVTNIIIFHVLLKTEAKPNQPGLIALLVGSAIFGVGLGITGLTPGTALIVSPVYFPEVLLFFLLPFLAGNWVSRYVERLLLYLSFSSSDIAQQYDEF